MTDLRYLRNFLVCVLVNKHLLLFLGSHYILILSFHCMIVFEPAGLSLEGCYLKVYFSYLSLLWKIFLSLLVK